MSKVETTTKAFKGEGVRITGSSIEIHWESTGHLSVQLKDELGQVELVERTVQVQIPKEGLVELLTDSDGTIFHPDVPFQDYELELGDGLRVHAPAVANRGDVHVRHVPGARFVFANLMVLDEAGDLVPGTEVQLEGPDGARFTVTSDAAGMVCDPTPRPDGSYRVTCAMGTAEVRLAARLAGISIVRLREEAAP